jgi:hypothetical protein
MNWTRFALTVLASRILSPLTDRLFRGDWYTKYNKQAESGGIRAVSENYWQLPGLVRCQLFAKYLWTLSMECDSEKAGTVLPDLLGSL